MMGEKLSRMRVSWFGHLVLMKLIFDCWDVIFMIIGAPVAFERLILVFVSELGLLNYPFKGFF